MRISITSPLFLTFSGELDLTVRISGAMYAGPSLMFLGVMAGHGHSREHQSQTGEN